MLAWLFSIKYAPFAFLCRIKKGHFNLKKKTQFEDPASFGAWFLQEPLNARGCPSPGWFCSRVRGQNCGTDLQRSEASFVLAAASTQCTAPVGRCNADFLLRQLKFYGFQPGVLIGMPSFSCLSVPLIL